VKRKDRKKIAKALRATAEAISGNRDKVRNLERSLDQRAQLHLGDESLDSGFWAISKVVSMNDKMVRFAIVGLKAFKWDLPSGSPATAKARRLVESTIYDDIGTTSDGWMVNYETEAEVEWVGETNKTADVMLNAMEEATKEVREAWEETSLALIDLADRSRLDDDTSEEPT
jgi:hypothetical protein